MKGKKTGGRKKGIPNRATVEMRSLLKGFLLQQWPEVKKAFEDLEGKEKIVAFSRLLPFVAPQYQAMSLSLHNMSEEDLQTLVDHVRETKTISIDE